MSGERRSGNFQIEGQPSEKGKEPYTQIRIATPGYFATIGTDLQKGRLFDARDDALGSRVVIVNQAFFDRYLSNDDFSGRRIRLGQREGDRFEIIGVVVTR